MTSEVITRRTHSSWISWWYRDGALIRRVGMGETAQASEDDAAGRFALSGVGRPNVWRVEE